MGEIGEINNRKAPESKQNKTGIIPHSKTT
jgi:hypothetical protein